MWEQPPSAVRPARSDEQIPNEEKPMKLNQQKVEDAVLAVLWLTLHDECRAWKTIDWGTMDRLHQKGYISDPAHRAKSVVLTEEGLSRAKQVVEKMLT